MMEGGNGGAVQDTLCTMSTIRDYPKILTAQPFITAPVMTLMVQLVANPQVRPNSAVDNPGVESSVDSLVEAHAPGSKP